MKLIFLVNEVVLYLEVMEFLVFLGQMVSGKTIQSKAPSSAVLKGK